MPAEISQNWPILGLLVGVILAMAGYIRVLHTGTVQKLEERTKALEAKLDAKEKELSETQQKTTAALLAGSERVFNSVNELAEARKILALRAAAREGGSDD